MAPMEALATTAATAVMAVMAATVAATEAAAGTAATVAGMAVTSGRSSLSPPLGLCGLARVGCGGWPTGRADAGVRT